MLEVQLLGEVVTDGAIACARSIRVVRVVTGDLDLGMFGQYRFNGGGVMVAVRDVYGNILHMKGEGAVSVFTRAKTAKTSAPCPGPHLRLRMYMTGN
jgi:hypothetical protein